MKTVVFSDTHLTENFDSRQFNAIVKIVQDANQVIINGDFWDGFFTSFEKFINSRWQELFPILKSKDTIYLFGNHDPEKLSDERRELFSIEQKLLHKLQVGQHSVHIEHGDRILPFYDSPSKYYPATLPHRFNEIIQKKIEKFIARFDKSHFYNKFQNKRIQRMRSALVNQEDILVTGHTHCPEFNLNEKFINVGMIRLGVLQYLEIIDDKMELKMMSY